MTTPSPPQSILYLDSGSGIGGGQRSLLLLLKHLDKNRFRPFVGCLSDNMLATEVRKANIPVVPLNLPAAHTKTDTVRRFTLRDIIGDLQQIGVILQLLQAVHAHHIKLIHANSLSTALIGGIVAKLTRIPIVMHKRYATSYGILDRICTNLVDRIILVSEATRLDFASPTKQELIYNGVEVEAFHCEEIAVEKVRRDLNLNSQDFFIGVVTRITPEKGIHRLIEAIAQLDSLPEIKLIIVGGSYFPKDITYIDELKGLAKTLSVEERVIFTGFLSDTRAITALLDIALVPSIIPEACPRTIIEAMAAGTPVIATALGGSQELVSSDTGILVAPDDATVFADAIASLAKGSKRRREMSEAARLRAVRFFSVQENTRLTEAVYERLLP